MPLMTFQQLEAFARDPAHGWSMGRFGAIGEFVRDSEDPSGPSDPSSRSSSISPDPTRAAASETASRNPAA